MRYLQLSIVAHASLLALACCADSHQQDRLEQREQAAEVASSLRATDVADTTRRLRDLQTIKQLLEESASRVASNPPENAADEATPTTPGEMVERARELSEAIEALDKEIEADELADLLGKPAPPPAAPAPAAPKDAGAAGIDNPAITPELAAEKVAALEADARATLAKHQQRMEARQNGVAVEGGARGVGRKAGDAGQPASSKARFSSALRTKVADFLATGPRVAQTLPADAYVGQVEDPSDRGNFAVPALDPSSLVLGNGRMLGTGGEYANRVYINSWYIIGPFPGRHGDQLFDNPVYPPERAVLLDAVYFGKGGRLLKWRYVSTQRYPLEPPDWVEDGVYYGYTEVSVDEDCNLVAWIGADDDAQIYVNDRLVWRGGKVDKMQYFNTIFAPGATHTRDYNRSEGTRVVHFNKGRNKIFFKLSNAAQGVFLSMVLTR